MHNNSLKQMQRLITLYLEDKRQTNLAILDVGSQDVNGTYKQLFNNPKWSYVGADICEGENVSIVLSQPYRWDELASGAYDIVVSGQAFEHIEYPWKSILEVRRVLKPGGLFFMVVPAVWPEHRYPVDCWRFYRDGVIALAKYASLEVIEAFTDWEHSDIEVTPCLDTVLVARRSVKQSLKQRILCGIESFVSRRL